MTEAALKTAQRGRFQWLDEGVVQEALRARNPGIPARDLKAAARIMSTVMDFVFDLPRDERSEIARERKPFRALLEEAAQSLGRAHIEDDGEIERSRGEGAGKLLSLEEGRARLDRYASAKPMEEWAGPVAGAGGLEERFGIKRTTLNSWYRDGAVVGLLRGQRKLAYPIEQFVDGRPLEGLGEIVRLAPDVRSAWLWTRQPHGSLDGRTPLELLIEGGRDRVLTTARRDFEREIV